MKTTKYTYKWLIAVLFLLLSGGLVNAQTITIRYAAPTDTINNHFGANQSFAYEYPNSSGDTILLLSGFRWVTLDASNEATFRSMAEPNMRRTYDSISTNTAALRAVINRVMRMKGNVNVEVLLVDDRNGLGAVDPQLGGDPDSDGKLFVWPHAVNWGTGNTYAGYVVFGTRALRRFVAQTGGWEKWEEVIIHEFSHTQFTPDPRYGYNKWNSIAIGYGGDQGHWLSEILADQQVPFEEGTGTFWGISHNRPSGPNELVRFLNDTSYRYSLGSRSFLTGTAAMWNAPHRVQWTGTVDTLPNWIRLNTSITNMQGSYQLRNYKWLDIPGEFVFYNEQMATALHYLFWQYGFANKNTARDYIFNALQNQVRPNVHDRYPAYLVNHIALAMEQYANTPDGQGEATAGTLRSSMFIYALFDILSHFGMSQANFQREMRINKVNNRLPQAYNHYFNHRNALKTRVQPYIQRNRINILHAVTEARNYFQQANTIVR